MYHVAQTLKEHSYEYKFIIGEEWILDPANPNTAFVPEVHSENSVLTVAE